MNICLATPEYLPTLGGIATYYGCLAELMAGHSHSVIVLTRGGARAPGHEVAGLRTANLERTARDWERQLGGALGQGHGPAVSQMAFGLAARDWFRANAARLQIDVVETVDYLGPGVFLVERGLPPVVVSLHGSLGQALHHEAGIGSGSAAISAGLEFVSLATADELLAHGQGNARDWAAYLGRQVNSARVPWRVQSSPRRSEHAATTAETKGTVIGRLQVWKGALPMVEALRQCRQDGLEAAIEWFGRDTHTAPNGQSMAQYLASSYPDLWGKSFRWHEGVERDRVPETFASSDFAVVPSLWDTFNYTGIEAMSAGTPVIVSSGAGMSYLCVDGENSLVVPPGDPAALANAMGKLASDRGLRERLASGALKTLSAEFAPGKIAADRLRVYESAIERRRYRAEHCYSTSALGVLFSEITRMMHGGGQDYWLARTGWKQLASTLLRKAGRRIGRSVGRLLGRAR